MWWLWKVTTSMMMSLHILDVAWRRCGRGPGLATSNCSSSRIQAACTNFSGWASVVCPPGNIEAVWSHTEAPFLARVKESCGAWPIIIDGCKNICSLVLLSHPYVVPEFLSCGQQISIFWRSKNMVGSGPVCGVDREKGGRERDGGPKKKKRTRHGNYSWVWCHFPFVVWVFLCSS